MVAIYTWKPLLDATCRQIAETVPLPLNPLEYLPRAIKLNTEKRWTMASGAPT